MARRKAIAKVIRHGFERLSRISEEKAEGEQDSATLEELIRKGESDAVEFKSSMRWDYKANQKGTEVIQLGVLKTIAAFMNSQGGTLIIGIDDNGNSLGLEKDYETFSDRKNWDGWVRYLVNMIRKYIGTEFMSNITLGALTYNGRRVAKSSKKF